MNPRKQAYDIFKAIVRDGKYSNLAFVSMLDGSVNELDRRFISALVYGTLDKLIQIDYIIALYAKGRLQPKIQDLLRLGVYQLLYMDKVPSYSVFSETLQLAQNMGKGALKGYLNGVLREIERNISHIPYPDKSTEPALYLSVLYSYPEFLVREFIDLLGFDTAEKMLSYSMPFTTSIRVNENKISAAAFETQLKQKHCEFSNGILYKNVFLMKGNRIFSDKLFKSGFCSVQSEASMLVCKTADPKPGQRILDCCSAPGGKAVYMAELMQQGQIVAMDIHEHRVELIRANAARCGFSGMIEPMQQDAAVYNESLGLFDTVLVDAPCSGLGVVAGKPDIKLNLTKQGLKELEQLQRNIIDTAARYVKSGGTLIYSTCTIREDENSNQVRAFLSKHNEFELTDLENTEKALPQNAVQNKMICLYPYLHGTDGFFIAKMYKK